MNENLKKAH
jgi:hypothetical protein